MESKMMGGSRNAGTTDAVTPKSAAPEIGQTVYDRDGRSGEYVAPLNGSHIVRPWVVMTTWDGEDEYGQPGGLDVWPEVFPSPPTAVLEAEIVRLQEDIELKRRELAIATDEAAGFIRDERERAARLKRHESLARLDDFISGNISHVVKSSYGDVSIHEFKAVIQSDDRYDRDGLKLLTLFGKPGLGLQWRLNQYKDGSGSDIDVTPCNSLEEATAIATALLNEAFARAGDERAYGLSSAVASADKLGIAVPSAARERAHADKLKDLHARRLTEQTALERIDGEIAAIEKAAGGSGSTSVAPEVSQPIREAK